MVIQVTSDVPAIPRSMPWRIRFAVPVAHDPPASGRIVR